MHDLSLANRKRLGLLASAAILFAACSNNTGANPTGTPAGVATQTPPSPGASAAPSGGAEAAVELGDNDALGSFLVGADGRTLYLFMSDTTTKSNCNAGCIENWPAFSVEAGTVKGGDGVTGTFGTITRDDGSTQVTYGGHPLYYFSGDRAAGDVNGQGLSSKWYVVGADGNAIMASTTSEGGKGSY